MADLQHLQQLRIKPINIDEEHKKYPPLTEDPHSDWTQQWTAAIDNVLLAAADAITLAGSYLDAVNNAGQFYTRADKDSFMPGLGTTQS
jgi:hypothetical protein